MGEEYTKQVFKAVCIRVYSMRAAPVMVAWRQIRLALRAKPLLCEGLVDRFRSLSVAARPIPLRAESWGKSGACCFGGARSARRLAATCSGQALPLRADRIPRTAGRAFGRAPVRMTFVSSLKPQGFEVSAGELVLIATY